jgi:hypothetical protein
MRTIKEIRAALKPALSTKYIERLTLELFSAISDGIDTERLEAICTAERENRLLILPAPIGDKIYMPGICYGIDERASLCIDESRLSGYVNEGGREFYTTYEEGYGTCDIEVDMLCVNKESAEKKLEEIKGRKCSVCGCTWDHACPGGCYWVAEDLCSKCAGL